MSPETEHASTHDVEALLDDDPLVDGAIASAQREAARRHLLLGQPIIVWRDGRVVELWPSDPEAAAILAGGR